MFMAILIIKFQRHTKMKVHKFLARPILCYAWTILTRDKRRIIDAEMRVQNNSRL